MIIKELKKMSNVKLGICSNTNYPFRQKKILESCGYSEDMFDICIYSGDVGIRKPNPQILN